MTAESAEAIIRIMIIFISSQRHHVENIYIGDVNHELRESEVADRPQEGRQWLPVEFLEMAGDVGLLTYTYSPSTY